MSFLTILAFQPLLSKYENFLLVCHLMMVMHFILTFYVSMVCFHVCRCVGMAWFSTSHGGSWPLPDVVPCYVLCILYTCFVIPALEGCATFHMLWMLLLLPIWQFLQKMDNGVLEIYFVCLTSNSMTTNISLKLLHNLRHWSMSVYINKYRFTSRAMTCKKWNSTNYPNLNSPTLANSSI